jgi:hypothetical protein
MERGQVRAAAGRLRPGYDHSVPRVSGAEGAGFKRRTIIKPPVETSVHCFDFTDIEPRGFRDFGFNFVCPETVQHSMIEVNIFVRHPRR